jgi:hypothetical protein
LSPMPLANCAKVRRRQWTISSSTAR